MHCGISSYKLTPLKICEEYYKAGRGIDISLKSDKLNKFRAGVAEWCLGLTPVPSGGGVQVLLLRPHKTAGPWIESRFYRFILAFSLESMKKPTIIIDRGLSFNMRGGDSTPG